ncbi:YybS family protein [Bacillus massilinigeriensis]|uniref:YybS family protein n=1 Tax=Bacillus massilionigeriensis TaxID=1805475 RepID=UPI00096B302F|nr:YybS family protein [Bacillus massilionigeriensis]
MKNVNRLTYGAILLAIFAVILLITLYIPVIGVIMNLFLPLPFIMFAGKNDNKSSFVFFIASIFISLIVGTLFAIPFTLASGMTGLIMGILIREGKGRFHVFIIGTLVFLLNLVGTYIISIVFFEVNFIKDSMNLLRDSFQSSMKLLDSLGQNPNDSLAKQFETSMNMLETLIPSIFVVASLMMVFLIELVNTPIAKRFGIQIKNWEPFRNISLPRSIIWYYLLTLLLSLILKPDIGSFVYTALMNISFILQFLLLIQGLSFIYYYSHIKGWSKIVPVIVTIILFFIPIVLYIVRILGIIDLGFDLRKRMEKNP